MSGVKEAREWELEMERKTAGKKENTEGRVKKATGSHDGG